VTTTSDGSLDRSRLNGQTGRIFEIVSQIVILIWLIAFSVETLPGLSATQRRVVDVTEWLVAVFFTVEYLIRLAVAKDRRKFVFSFFGIIDLVAILPFYFTLIPGLSTLRALRLLRLARLLKLARYSEALHRMYRAWMKSWEEFTMFFLLAMILLFIAASGIHHFEHKAQPTKFTSIFTSFWWAICTLTTVGYGDVYPITTGGRVFTCFVLMIGLGIVAVPTGLITSSMTQVRREDDQNRPVSGQGNPPVS